MGMTETPQAAARRFSGAKIKAGFKPEGLYEYKGHDGNILFHRIRLKHPETGKKVFWPMHLNGSGYVLKEPEFPKGKPLYRLPDLSACLNAPVWLGEGEECANALAKLGLVATTSGAADSAIHADWSPLAGREVIIWPDNDEPGFRYANECLTALREVGARVRLVDVAKLNLPKGGDAVNWLAEHADATQAALDRLPIVDAPAPASAVAPRVRVIEVADFLELTLPPRDHILSPWLPTQGLGMLHAPRGVGKTHVALGIAYAVACGGTFLRWSAPKPRGVLFIDGEMPAITLQERLARIIAPSDLALTAPLRLITPDLQSLGMPDLSSADGQLAIDAYMDGIALIVVDNISTLCRSGKENEAEGWLTVQGWALHQRAQGRSVLFIHHSGKGGAQRGTSKREDVLDTVIGLRRPPDHKAEDGAAFELHFEKSRGFYGKDAEPFEAQLITDAHDRQTWAVRSLEDSTLERVVQLLRDGLSQKDISIKLGLSKSTVNYHAKRAKEDGRVPR